MSTAAATTTVVCPECHHENEPERVYCHDCGARLDRSAVKVHRENVEEQRKRVKKLFDPQRAKMRALFPKVSKMLVGAFVVAIAIQLFLPPDMAAPSKSESLASQIRLDLENATQHRGAPPLTYTEVQINQFLAYVLKTKAKALQEPLLDFRRAVVQFNENECSVTMERAVSGYYPVYTTMSFTPKLEGGKIKLQAKSGHLGRMPIHPLVVKYMPVLFADLGKALDSELRMVGRMSAVDVHDKAIVLTPPR